MSDLLTPTFLLILLFSTIRTATPLIFAALGGMFSERAGVINIALEGLMLAGAFTAAVVTYELSNPYLGFLAGLASCFFHDTATTEIYTLSLHDALPALAPAGRRYC